MTARTILIIDDDKELCNNLEDILKDNGYEPFSVSTGAEGLMLTRTLQPHVVLLDHKLPDCDGTVLLSNIKQISPDSFCIIITAYADIDSAVYAMEQGAFHYLRKPFSPGELLQLLIRIFEVIHLREEKKNAEEYLRDSEEKYRTLVNNVNVGVYRNSCGPYGQFIQVNPAMIRIFGYDSIEEFMKIPVADLYQDPNERKRYIEKIQAIGSVKDEELRMKKRNGMPIWVSVTARVQYNETGDIQWIDGVLHDITKRKKAEEALHKSEEKFRSLVETVSDWIWEIDLNGVYTYSSPRAKEFLGYDAEEIIGKTPFDLMPEEEAKRISDVFKDIVKSKKPFTNLENTCIHKDGRYIILETSGVPILDMQGHLLGYRGIDHDITERKLAEEEIKKRIDQLEEFYEMAVGRELRMIQLKKEIAELKEEIAAYKNQ
jgi:PAS domain S-box-containing protein